jgi:hypothetical protein
MAACGGLTERLVLEKASFPLSNVISPLLLTNRLE